MGKNLLESIQSESLIYLRCRNGHLLEVASSYIQKHGKPNGSLRIWTVQPATLLQTMTFQYDLYRKTSPPQQVEPKSRKSELLSHVYSHLYGNELVYPNVL
ncbi:hypothetical protein J6590_003354 [Homalodisca vitripennis]|nr:hypothetical protein J6590_003354 [Homalodisca vitripennis]